MRVLLIKNNIVENCILADSVERAQLFYPDYEIIEQPDGVGLGFIRIDGVWTAPEPVVVQEDRKITRLAFMNRFADNEAIAIDLASIGATPQAAFMRLYQSKVAAATFIDLNDQNTRNGVIALESAGILAQGRALEILDGPIREHEKLSFGVL